MIPKHQPPSIGAARSAADAGSLWTSQPLLYRADGHRSLTTALLATLAFFLLQLFLVQYHEMWRDELQAWLLARDSHDIPELFRNLKYEGHPGFWYLMLMPLTRVAASPVAMQVLHVTIASASIYVLVRYAPFSGLVTLLFCLSYYLFYEYVQVARNYAIGVLLIFILCALFPRRSKNSTWMALTLFVLCHTSAMGIIIVLAFCSTVVMNRVMEIGFRREILQLSPTQILAAGIVIIGLFSSILQIIPPYEFVGKAQWAAQPHTETAPMIARIIARMLMGGYLPLPMPTQAYWNTLQLLSLPHAVAAVVLMGIPLAAVLLLRQSPFALTFFIVSTTVLLMFFVMRYHGFLRHHGFVFIALIAALWISRYSGNLRPRRRWVGMAGTVGAGYLVIVLLVQAAAGLMAASKDYTDTFSNAGVTADFLKANGLDRGLIAGETDYAASAVSGFLKTPIYYPSSQRYGTFVKWDAKRKKIDQSELLSQLVLIAPSDGSLILLTNAALYGPEQDKVTFINQRKVALTRLFEADGAVVESENFFVYRVNIK